MVLVALSLVLFFSCRFSSQNIFVFASISYGNMSGSILFHQARFDSNISIELDLYGLDFQNITMKVFCMFQMKSSPTNGNGRYCFHVRFCKSHQMEIHVLAPCLIQLVSDLALQIVVLLAISLADFLLYL